MSDFNPCFCIFLSCVTLHMISIMEDPTLVGVNFSTTIIHKRALILSCLDFASGFHWCIYRESIREISCACRQWIFFLKVNFYWKCNRDKRATPIAPNQQWKKKTKGETQEMPKSKQLKPPIIKSTSWLSSITIYFFILSIFIALSVLYFLKWKGSPLDCDCQQ